MRILLTNDDGLQSSSLEALSARLKQDHDVGLVAPDTERSASSHSITLNGAIEVANPYPGVYACNGTPADCVALALLGLIEVEIDLVISGPNRGPNLGTDIIYSGTAAAARQAVLMGVPAVAVSLAADNSHRIDPLSLEFLARNIPIFLKLASCDHFLNVNLPASMGNHADIRVTCPSIRIYDDVLDIVQRKDGKLSCRITGPTPKSHPAPGSDYDAIAAGAVSISPISTHPVNQQIEERYESAEFWTGES